MGSIVQGFIFLGSGCREFRFHILWHMFVFLQWGNLNWYRQYGFPHPRNPYMHAYMDIFGVSKYMHKKCMALHIWIFPIDKSILLIQFGFIHQRNPNWCQKYGFFHQGNP